MSPGTSDPFGHGGGPVLLLDYLLRMRKDVLAGRVEMYLGDTNVDSLRRFIDGYHACLRANHIADPEYGRFFEWLREVKKEFPSEGWAAKYLRDCHGDHEQAIRKYLDFVAEFVSLSRK